ncbi:error-prone DNA polymerase [Halomonas sp. S2151]|uniref:error-prone DNA polymerase n=1 Tax=Halomonas sp. S2151 TaxID=579478 RepID=UPI0009FF5E57|nr:error-prone DNA polymerase [Halomonas sp. S2151]
MAGSVERVGEPPDAAEVAPGPGYAELHCLSNFTFLKGASHPHELVARAAELGYRALAITDECSVAGIVRAWEAARDHRIALIVGAEFRLADEVVVVLAENRCGYASLCRLITLGRRRAPKGSYRLDWEDLEALEDCLLLYLPGNDDARTRERMDGLKQHFDGRCWVMVQRHFQASEEERLARRMALASAAGLPLVASGGVLMHQPSRKRLQDVLTALRHRTSVQRAGFLLEPNAERCLRPLSRLAQCFAPALLEQSLRIAERCRFDPGELRYEYPEELVPDGHTPSSWLAHKVRQGERLRFPEGTPSDIAEQIARELELIARMAYEPFFLTIEDIVAFARRQGILCQGRGSAANSVVCYCLFITEVDPRQVQLLFERFISEERDEPPDIDVDFEHERREEVIQYIYRRYGRERAGLAATVISYRPRSALKDVGRALGLQPGYLAWLASRLDRREGEGAWLEALKQTVGETVGGGGEEAASTAVPELLRHLVELVEQLLGFPRHLSQHVGGFVISRGPLHELVPVENAAMEGRTLIQWNKDDLESLGLLKVDVLALGMLTAIRKTLALLSDGGEHRDDDRRCYESTGESDDDGESKGEGEHQAMAMSRVPRDDPEVYAMLSRGDSVGVFQVESRAQMNMLPRLKPRNYYDLVIEIAIVRPGPIQGDMVHPYLRRRDGIEEVSYPSDEVRGVLERTLGVPIFQEQVIKLAMVAAGYSGGEADQLRRAMAAWRRAGTIAEHQQRLTAGLRARGYSDEFANAICRQIEGFGQYGFPESHAASFAHLVYVSAWLKCHHPAAFCCGLLNSQPMGFYSPSQLVQDARRHDVEVRPVDINASHWDATLEPDGGLRLGFRLVKGLGRGAIDSLLARRPANGYASVAEARRRAPMSAREWEALAAAGALSSLGGHRYQARWNLLAPDPALALGETDILDDTTPELAPPSEQADLEEDFRHLGLSLARHPMALLREQTSMARQGLARCLKATELAELDHGHLVQVAGLVTTRQRPGTASGVTFVTLEDETGNVNVVVWKDTAKAQRQALLNARLLKVTGHLEREGSVIHVIAGRLEDLSGLWAELGVPSRDFR